MRTITAPPLSDALGLRIGEELPRTLENGFEHGGREPSGIRVQPRAMVAADELIASQIGLRAMAARWRRTMAGGSDSVAPRHPAHRDEYARPWEVTHSPRQ